MRVFIAARKTLQKLIVQCNKKVEKPFKQIDLLFFETSNATKRFITRWGELNSGRVIRGQPK